MMSAEGLIRAGGATLAFDTNAIIGREKKRLVFGGFYNICDDVSRLRAEESSPLNISIVVPALARMEALHDLRVERAQRGEAFDEEHVRGALGSKALVADFNDDAAIKASRVLHRWFADDEAWQRAKRERCLEALGLRKEHLVGGHGLASIDWAIAAHAEAEGWILVTADQRAEFENVSHKITRQALRELLDKLLEERGLAPSGGRRR